MTWGILDIIYFLRERKFAFADYTTKGYNSTLLYYILYFNTKKKTTMISWNTLI